MDSYFKQIVTYFMAPPGNLVYHIILAFSIAGALQAAVHHWRTSGYPQTRRTMIGLAILLGLQVLLFATSVLSWKGNISLGTILPSLDRTVSLLSLVWISWLWIFPEPVRLAEAASLLLSFLGMALFGLTALLASEGIQGGYNLSIYETVWQGFSLIVVILGVVGMVVRRPNGWGNGLAMMILAFLGHLISLLWRIDGDLPGFVRLAHLGMFPILLTLTQRFQSPLEQEHRKPLSVKGNVEEGVLMERRRYSTDPKTFQSLITLAAETSSEKTGLSLTRGIAQAMLADLCFLLSYVNEKSLKIACGYDLIREESLGGTAVSMDSIPMLANSIQRNRPVRLPASSTSSDLKGLGQVLGLSNPGHLMLVPFASPEGRPVGGILLLSPYSNRLWSAEDQAYLGNVALLLLPLIERSERLTALQMERDHLHLEIQQYGEVRKVQGGAPEVGITPEIGDQGSLQAENIATLMLVQEENRKTIENLRAENELLKSTNPVPAAGDAQLERDLRQTLEEMARMQNLLAESNQKIMELETKPSVPITSEQVEVIASISQELRQPMSSIVGYTDLLLGESVGILGSLQRKFVERIKASTERIGGLVEDLIQITNLDTKQIEFRPEPIDLNLIIDNAMAYTSTQIREKNITLRLDIPETSPQVKTDRDALQQILIHLLQNATAVTQMEGTITLRVQIKEEQGKGYLAIQVSDTGGGIATEDLPRVFARRYRAEHSLIQGVGDTGVGLSIAKTLVEAQNGRIWVETEANVGSTFSAILPVLPAEGEG